MSDISIQYLCTSAHPLIPFSSLFIHFITMKHLDVQLTLTLEHGINHTIKFISDQRMGLMQLTGNVVGRATALVGQQPPGSHLEVLIAGHGETGIMSAAGNHITFLDDLQIFTDLADARADSSKGGQGCALRIQWQIIQARHFPHGAFQEAHMRGRR